MTTVAQSLAVTYDSERSQDEKIAHQDEEANTTVPYTSDLPPDPDAHLSPEERANILSILRRAEGEQANYRIGQETTLEARPDLNPVGKKTSPRKSIILN